MLTDLQCIFAAISKGFQSETCFILGRSASSRTSFLFAADFLIGTLALPKTERTSS